MKSKESTINEILGLESIPVRVVVPQAFFHRLKGLGRRKFGSLPKGQIVAKSLLYSAALGVLSWEKDMTKKSRKVTVK